MNCARSLGLAVLAAGLVAPGAAPAQKEAEAVSIVRLLADPDAWQGRVVDLQGFVRFEGAQGAIFLHDVDEEFGLSHNALLLDMNDPVSLDPEWVHRDMFQDGEGRYAFVRGTFDAQRAGHYGEFAGTLRQVEQMRAWGAPSQGELSGDPHGPERVPFVRVLANPQAFDDHWIVLRGPATVEFEGNAIYLGPDRDSTNGIWLDLTPQQFQDNKTNSGRVISVRGVFDASDRGHMGMFSGSLGNIDWLRVETPREMPAAPESGQKPR